MADKNDVKGSADKAADAKATTQSASKEPVKHVKMKRKTPQHPGGPMTANVHPSEVSNFMEDGWREE